MTRHLIYSRFWNQFLFDIGEVPNREPYKKRTAQGMILGADNEKMSKSKGNVINPMEIITEFGADTLRAYILFIGDYEMPTPWNENGVKGCRRFLDKVWRLLPKVNTDSFYSEDTLGLVHKTIKGVSEDIENLKFNTAIAKLMTLTNVFTQKDVITYAEYETLLKLVNPFAPHLAEELYSQIGHEEMIVNASWPEYDESKLIEDVIEVVVSINGKVKDKMMIPNNLESSEMEKLARALPKIQELLSGSVVRKVIVVPNKLVNIVI